MENAHLLVLLLALSGCVTDPLSDGGSGDQSWTFTLYNENNFPVTNATSVLRAGGASAGFVTGWRGWMKRTSDARSTCSSRRASRAQP